MKHKVNQPTQFTGAEKVLWKYNYNFHIGNGKTTQEATILADEKIKQTHNLSRSLTYKF